MRPMARPAVGIAEAGRAAHHDVALLGGHEVERGVARPGGDEQLQLGKRLDDRARKRRALAHADDDVEIGERLDHLVLAAERLR